MGGCILISDGFYRSLPLEVLPEAPERRALSLANCNDPLMVELPFPYVPWAFSVGRGRAYNLLQWLL